MRSLNDEHVKHKISFQARSSVAVFWNRYSSPGLICASDLSLRHQCLVLNPTNIPVLECRQSTKDAGGPSSPPPPEAEHRLLAPLSLSVEHVLINAADRVGGASPQTVEGAAPAFCEPLR